MAALPQKKKKQKSRNAIPLLNASLRFFLQDSFLPPSQRTNYECDKAPTGPLDRKKLIDHINKQALETPDRPELEPFVPGVVRGKKVRSRSLGDKEDPKVRGTLFSHSSAFFSSSFYSI